MRRFGLIGRPLGHSASAAYFTEKFNREGVTDCEYSLYELGSIGDLPGLLERLPRPRPSGPSTASAARRTGVSRATTPMSSASGPR